MPVIIRDSSVSGRLEEALIENLQREDLNSLEEAGAFQKLIEEYEYTQEEIAKKIGKDRSTIANSLRLLVLSPAVRKLILEEKLSAGHARALITIEDPKRQEEVAKEIVSKELSVRQAEALARSIKKTKNKTISSAAEDPFLSVLQQELSQHFKAKVKIHLGGKKGRLEIEFYGEEDLNRIVSLLKA